MVSCGVEQGYLRYHRVPEPPRLLYHLHVHVALCHTLDIYVKRMSLSTHFEQHFRHNFIKDFLRVHSMHAYYKTSMQDATFRY